MPSTDRAQPAREAPAKPAPTVAPVADLALAERDLGARRPPVLGFLLRWDSLRRAGRVVTLLALDLAAIFLAIFTGPSPKALVRRTYDGHACWQQARDSAPFAFFAASLLFARSG